MKVLSREEVTRRIAENVANLFNQAEETVVINLGVGIPNNVSDYVTNENVFIQGENGLLGVGRLAEEHEVLPNLINSGRQPVVETPGCSYFDSATAFGMIRGGYIEAAVLGAFEVDGKANVANWIIPGGKMLGVGGAMDLVNGANTLVIAMRQTDREGKSKLVKECSLPLTGKGRVKYVFTEWAGFHFVNGKWVLESKADDISIEELKSITEFDFDMSDNLKTML